MMTAPLKTTIKNIVFITLLAFLELPGRAITIPPGDSARRSTPAQALQYLGSIKDLQQSKWWPNVPPAQLLNNLRTFTIEPLAFYEGKTTNFCSYSALTYIPLTYDPLGFARFMIELYKNGQANFGKNQLKPSKPVRMEAGLLRYKGSLDINPAGQMWFLTLADHYKGYLNFFNRRFQKGDENTFWASTNFAKFNRMLRRLFKGTIKAQGADLFRPAIKDLPSYLETQMQKGLVFLYLNNKKLYRKSHKQSLISTPTHYVLLTNIRKLPDGNIEFEYWDYGARALQQLSPEFLKNIIYGVSVWTPRVSK
ncbi:hypothetical protein LL912_09175 [Niabella sp. CC-SYL272]|uniref:hypothetical protein n=1 Tax=Niabella agricola TaxID=2891571 RepID=UPI001F170336|nr:hypothetical protein [Niabella agricola]MCF3108948.1 hypothetical protein [Niabella agricola]